jgi:hypothetical protein
VLLETQTNGMKLLAFFEAVLREKEEFSSWVQVVNHFDPSFLGYYLRVTPEKTFRAIKIIYDQEPAKDYYQKMGIISENSTV